MIVRMRFQHGPRIQREAPRPTLVPDLSPERRDKPRRDANHVPVADVAGGLATFLTPAAFGSTGLALWRLGADAGLTHPFAFTDGILSHWQVWFTLAALLSLSSLGLGRRRQGGNGGRATS